jgi:hypothetical protein
MPTPSKYSFIYSIDMDSTRLYQQYGIGVLGLDCLTCSVSRVDLCHQAIDHEEKENGENYEQTYVHFHISKTYSHHHIWCIPL